LNIVKILTITQKQLGTQHTTAQCQLPNGFTNELRHSFN